MSTLNCRHAGSSLRTGQCLAPKPSSLHFNQSLWAWNSVLYAQGPSRS